MSNVYYIIGSTIFFQLFTPLPSLRHSQPVVQFFMLFYFHNFVYRILVAHSIIFYRLFTPQQNGSHYSIVVLLFDFWLLLLHNYI